MTATNKEEGVPDPIVEEKSLESFMSAYMNSYREYISGKDMDDIHTPQFFKGYPFNAEIYDLSNGAVCTIFKKSSRPKFAVLEGDFESLASKLRSQDLDFMVVFPPFTSFTEDEAKRMARMDADRDLRSSRRLEMLTAAESHLSSIHGDIQSVADLNPWLDQQAAEQRKKLDRARELILELYKEVEVSREERFSDYTRQLSEVMAFEKKDMEEVASEIETEVETAIEEMESRLSEMEKAMEGLGNSSEISEKAGKEVSKLSIRLDKLESAGSPGEFRSSLSKLQSAIRDLTRDFKDIQDGCKTANADLTEMKETVQRDSKRTYNLNERVTDLERSIAALNQDAGKDSMAAIRALEGRINVMDKNVKELSKQRVRTPESAPTTVYEESPTVETIGTTPSGATVKKTVKRTTARKTTRSK